MNIGLAVPSPHASSYVAMATVIVPLLSHHDITCLQLTKRPEVWFSHFCFFYLFAQKNQ